MGVTRTNGLPGLPGNNNFKVFKAGADKLGYKECHTGRMAINSVERDGRNCLPADRILLPGLQVGSEMVDALYRNPQGRGDRQPGGSSRSRMSRRSSTMPRARSPASPISTPTASCSDRRRALSRSRAIRSKARVFCSTQPRPSFQTGSPIPRARSGATICVTPLGRSTPSLSSRFTCIAARPWLASCGTKRETIRAAVLPAATNWRRSPWASPSWRPSSIRVHGAASSPPRSTDIRIWPGCGSSARTCRRRRTALPSATRRTNGACRSRTCISTTTRTTLRCVTMPSARAGRCMRRSAPRAPSASTPPYPSTHNLGTNRMSANARDGVVNSHGQTHDIQNLFISDGSQFTTGRAENPTLTIVTLAIRQADYIADQMKSKTIGGRRDGVKYPPGEPGLHDLHLSKRENWLLTRPLVLGAVQRGIDIARG